MNCIATSLVLEKMQIKTTSTSTPTAEQLKDKHKLTNTENYGEQ